MPAMIATATHRPVATTLLSLGLALAGCVAFGRLQVSPLPQVDFPTIQVQASMAGASPETMAATVATPLERRLGQIAGLTAMHLNQHRRRYGSRASVRPRS
jgi:multidrug efflux pump